MVKINVLMPFVKMSAGVNALLKPGTGGGMGSVTVRLSVASELSPASEFSVAVLANVPALAAVTSTLTVQVDAAATVPPE
jgi:hypothetical protein